MATELKVPTLEMDMEEVSIVRWLVEEGAEVRKGDPILEIDTDKTSFEIEASADGVIHNLSAGEGESVPVGATLAIIAAPGEEIEESPTAPSEAGHAGTNGASSQDSDRTMRKSPVTRSSENGREVRASPAARQAAAERGIPIENVSGSGPYGRVYLSDVLETEAAAQHFEPEAATANRTEEHILPTPLRREPLSRVRRLGAERTARSFSEVPHFYLTRDLDVERVLELRDRLQGKLDPPPSITDLLALVVSRTLRHHSRLNGRYEDGELIINSRVNLGIAVATDDGLVVPVLKGADAMPLRDLVPAAKDLVSRARNGRLGPEDLAGGTFTISNLGMMEIDSFDAVINTPEAAILALGRVRTVPEWQEGEWVPKQVISATLSVDHRAADGADGSRFLMDLQKSLRDWELLL